MDALKIYYDEEGKTLSVWFDDPRKEFLTEETEEDLSLIKDKDGRVIGFERLNYSLEKPDAVQVELTSNLARALSASRSMR